MAICLVTIFKSKMKRFMDQVVNFFKREWFLFLVLGVIGLIFFFFEVFLK